MLHGAVQYLKKNWGAPFVIAFIFCLLGYAAELSLGTSSLANEFATYGFYSLAIGVALQIAAYVKHSEPIGQPETRPPSKPIKAPSRLIRLSRRQKILVITAIALVLGGSVSAYYVSTLPKVVITLVVVTSVTKMVTNGSTVTGTSTIAISITNTVSRYQKYAPLTAVVGPVDSINEPGGSVLITFIVSAQGGAPPYDFVANWGDGVVQNNTLGGFQRIFLNQTIPAFVGVAVVSADGQATSLKIEIPGA